MLKKPASAPVFTFLLTAYADRAHYQHSKHDTKRKEAMLSGT